MRWSTPHLSVALFRGIAGQTHALPQRLLRKAQKRVLSTPVGRQSEWSMDAGILEEVTGQKRNRIYMAREIASVIAAD